MFHNSTQKETWVFESERHLTRFRAEANATYCQKHFDEAIRNGCQFLTSSEEQLLCKYYMKKLLEFCNLFRPPVPRSVLGTAASYFKRFYLHTSVMEYHPKDIQFCCAYIAFKVEEYNVSIDEFVKLLSKDIQEPIADMTIQNELLMLKRLKFHLVVHSPFRPLEGFIIDLKTRSNVANPDSLRVTAEKFLMDSLHSDTVLLYPPSQLALCALHYSAKSAGIDLSGYVRSAVLSSGTDDQIAQLYRTLTSIEELVTNVKIPEYSEIAHIEEQLKTIQSFESPVIKKRRSEETLEAERAKRSKQEDHHGFSHEEAVLPSSHYTQLQGIKKM